MEGGKLLDNGQTGVIVVNHVMADLDGEHEEGAVPIPVRSMEGKTVLELILKQLLKHATHFHVQVSIIKCKTNQIGGVMVRVLASSALDRGFEHDRVKPKTVKLVCVASPLSTQH
jgi:hypothetical protein